MQQDSVLEQYYPHVYKSIQIFKDDESMLKEYFEMLLTYDYKVAREDGRGGFCSEAFKEISLLQDSLVVQQSEEEVIWDLM